MRVLGGHISGLLPERAKQVNKEQNQVYLYHRGKRIKLKSATAGNLKVLLMQNGLLEEHADRIVKLWKSKVNKEINTICVNKAK